MQLTSVMFFSEYYILKCIDWLCSAWTSDGYTQKRIKNKNNESQNWEKRNYFETRIAVILIKTMHVGATRSELRSCFAVRNNLVNPIEHHTVCQNYIVISKVLYLYCL